MRIQPTHIAALAFLACAPAIAFADVVWPALFLETRMFTWWSILIGLALEYLFVRRVFSLSAKRAVMATVVANTVSALAGLPLIPIVGIFWEIFPGMIYTNLLKWGTFNPITWGATFFLACLINTAIEAAVYRHAFKLSVQRRQYLWLFVANAASVGVAFASLFIVPIEA